jgi:16S rRNA G966 N2-methylase RsmD
LKQADGFELWQAHPRTGRNHQIRIHASGLGIPVLGDSKYGGAEFPFLCLHNRKIEFPNGVVIESEAPAYFETLSTLNDVSLSQKQFEVDRRLRLYAQSTGEDWRHEQRLQLAWVQENSSGKSVLNLFAGTGSFAAAAIQGGAREVIGVELNKKSLNVAKENLANAERLKLLCRDSLTYLDQCLGKGLKFDLVICEVPAFFRREKGVFKIESDLEKLIESCLAILEPGAVLLLSTSSAKIFPDMIRKYALKAQASLGLKALEINSVQPSLDFHLPDEPSQLKSFLFRIVGAYS